jgi:hypothetical protein
MSFASAMKVTAFLPMRFLHGSLYCDFINRSKHHGSLSGRADRRISLQQAKCVGKIQLTDFLAFRENWLSS